MVQGNAGSTALEWTTSCDVNKRQYIIRFQEARVITCIVQHIIPEVVHDTGLAGKVWPGRAWSLEVQTREVIILLFFPCCCCRDSSSVCCCATRPLDAINVPASQPQYGHDCCCSANVLLLAAATTPTGTAATQSHNNCNRSNYSCSYSCFFYCYCC